MIINEEMVLVIYWLCLILVVYLSHVIEHNVQIYIFIAAMFGPITVLWITLETAIPVAIWTPLFNDFFT